MADKSIPSLSEQYALLSEENTVESKPTEVEKTETCSEKTQEALGASVSNVVQESFDEAKQREESASDDAGEETPEVKLETAPADFRFPTTNQTRHCFTRYIEYHRCVAAKGEDASDCDRFAKYYRALCPGEWVDRWNDQRENGTFPGPL